MPRPELKIGVVDQSPVRTGGTGADAVRETLELARVAERLGYSRYWLAEHHSTNSFACASPEVLAAAVAAATREIRVGTGGVLLPHYSPLKVAEQFRMLEALHPGRIDLGIGRAPGGNPRASGALRYGRDPLPIALFPRQVEDLLAWLANTHETGPFARVRAMPRGPGVPDVWLLGSGGESAEHAAALGCGYCFAQFISGEDGAARVEAYRRSFRPSAHRTEPAASVAVGVVCAGTRDEAMELASGLELWRRRIAFGQDRGIPSPAEARAELGPGWTLPAPRPGDGARVVVGGPDEVRRALLGIAAHYGVDEVLAVTVVHDFAARVRSHELLAEALGLERRG